MYLGYSIDGGADQTCVVISPTSVSLGLGYNASFSRLITGLSAGSHTIKLRMRVGTATTTSWSLLYGSSTFTCEFDILQASTIGGSSSTWTSFTPTVTLVGGSGNTVPVYTTNSGRYTTIGKTVFVDIFLTGDGGAEGAGTGLIYIALPVTPGASQRGYYFAAGFLLNGAASYAVIASIDPSDPRIALSYITGTTTVDFPGSLQNSTTRVIRLKFHYEID